MSELNIIDVNEKNFEEKVLLESENKLIVVDFWAPWCGPCKELGPNIEKAVSSTNGKVVLAKVNIDENSDVPVNYGVRNIPTLLVFKNGEVVDKVVGNQPKSKLVEILTNHM